MPLLGDVGAHTALVLEIAVLGGSAALAFVLVLLAERLIARLATRGPQGAAALLAHVAGPVRLGAPLIGVLLAMPGLRLPAGVTAVLGKVVGILLIGSVAWLLVRLVDALEAAVEGHFSIERADNLRARQVRTQWSLIRRVSVIVILVVAIASALMLFHSVRRLGASILASAGVAGIIIGLAAQKTIGAVLAGLQIAVAQPIRIEDVVIVEGEWGRIEEITLTYVVVKIWDERRLVVPTTYFMEKPFQNWTRTSAELLGTVYLYVDYSVPVGALRQRLEEIVSETELWDGRVCGLVVTDASERSVQVRALVSARDASQAWDLRCLVRERLLEFLRESFPGGLPRLRAEVEQTGGAAPEGLGRQSPG